MTSRCPYDPNHIMPTDSLINHLRKCKATNKNQFAQCKYNQLHIILKNQIDHHYQECQDNPNRGKKQSQIQEEQWDSQRVHQSRLQDWGDDIDLSEIVQPKKQKRGNRGDYPNHAAAPPQILYKYQDQIEEKLQTNKYAKKWEKTKPKKTQKSQSDKKQFQQAPFMCDESIIQDSPMQKLNKKPKKDKKSYQNQSFKTHTQKSKSGLGDF